MSWARRHPILLGAISFPVLLAAGLWTKDSLEWRSFYEKHRLVKEIDQHARSTDMATPIILKYVPLGTVRSEVMEAMSQEGFDCRQWADGDRVDCGLQGPASFGRTGRRHIQFAFNGDARLADARELPLK
jgi:hypothetical protein